MDNPVKEFAAVVQRQLNRLIAFDEIDYAVFERSLEEWQELGGIEQWKRQDLRRLRNYLLIRDADATELRNLPIERGRTDTRVKIAFRLFGFKSQVIQARQKAIDFCLGKPEFSSVPACISTMAIAHRKWKQDLLQGLDLRDARHEWNEAYSDLMEWVEEIGTYQIEPVGIPPEYRSKAISKKLAAKLLGQPNEDSGVRWLNACIKDGTIACEQLSPLRNVFDIRQFPETAKRQLTNSR